MEEENRFKVRELEKFVVDGTLDDIESTLDTLKDKQVKEMIKYAKKKTKPILNRYGDEVDKQIILNPTVIANMFFKPITPLRGQMPTYTAEKLGILFDYYLDLISEVNDKIGYFPASLTSFCKLAGITTSELRRYKSSNDYSMRVVAEKIYDEIGDSNMTMAQMGYAKERTTMFKLKAQHEMEEKVSPKVNITYKEVVNKKEIEEKLNKYKKILNKVGDIDGRKK